MKKPFFLMISFIALSTFSQASEKNENNSNFNQLEKKCLRGDVVLEEDLSPEAVAETIRKSNARNLLAWKSGHTEFSQNVFNSEGPTKIHSTSKWDVKQHVTDCKIPVTVYSSPFSTTLSSREITRETTFKDYYFTTQPAILGSALDDFTGGPTVAHPSDLSQVLIYIAVKGIIGDKNLTEIARSYGKTFGDIAIFRDNHTKSFHIEHHAGSLLNFFTSGVLSRNSTNHSYGCFDRDLSLGTSLETGMWTIQTKNENNEKTYRVLGSDCSTGYTTQEIYKILYKQYTDHCVMSSIVTDVTKEAFYEHLDQVNSRRPVRQIDVPKIINSFFNKNSNDNTNYYTLKKESEMDAFFEKSFEDLKKLREIPGNSGVPYIKFPVK